MGVFDRQLQQWYDHRMIKTGIGSSCLSFFFFLSYLFTVSSPNNEKIKSIQKNFPCSLFVFPSLFALLCMTQQQKKIYIFFMTMTRKDRERQEIER